MGECIGTGPHHPPDGGERTAEQLQGIADIIEADGMGELGVEHGHNMTPRGDGSGPGLRPGAAGHLADQPGWNEVAYLATLRKCDGVGMARFVFSPAPCGAVTNSCQRFF